MLTAYASIGFSNRSGAKIAAMTSIASTSRGPGRLVSEFPSSAHAVRSRNDAAATPELVLQPSLRFVISYWPVMSIWSAHQAGGDIEKISGWTRKAERIALWRNGDSIRFALLSSAQFSFRHSLSVGLGLETAAARALTHEPMFDLVGALVSLFGDGLVTGIRTNQAQ